MTTLTKVVLFISLLAAANALPTFNLNQIKRSPKPQSILDGLLGLFKRPSHQNSKPVYRKPKSQWLKNQSPKHYPKPYNPSFHASQPEPILPYKFQPITEKPIYSPVPSYAEPESVYIPEQPIYEDGVYFKPVPVPEPSHEPVPAYEPEPEPPTEPEIYYKPVTETEPVYEPEPVTEPLPVYEPEPVTEPLPVYEPVTEPLPVYKPEPVSEEPKPVYILAEPYKEPEPVYEPAPAYEPEPKKNGHKKYSFKVFELDSEEAVAPVPGLDEDSAPTINDIDEEAAVPIDEEAAPPAQLDLRGSFDVEYDDEEPREPKALDLDVDTLEENDVNEEAISNDHFFKETPEEIRAKAIAASNAFAAKLAVEAKAAADQKARIEAAATAEEFRKTHTPEALAAAAAAEEKARIAEEKARLEAEAKAAAEEVARLAAEAKSAAEEKVRLAAEAEAAAKERARLETEAFAANQARLNQLFQRQEIEKAKLADETQAAIKERAKQIQAEELAKARASTPEAIAAKAAQKAALELERLRAEALAAKAAEEAALEAERARVFRRLKEPKIISLFDKEEFSQVDDLETSEDATVETTVIGNSPFFSETPEEKLRGRGFASSNGQAGIETSIFKTSEESQIQAATESGIPETSEQFRSLKSPKALLGVFKQEEVPQVEDLETSEGTTIETTVLGNGPFFRETPKEKLRGRGFASSNGEAEIEKEEISQGPFGNIFTRNKRKIIAQKINALKNNGQSIFGSEVQIRNYKNYHPIGQERHVS